MIKAERERAILQMLEDCGVLSVQALSRLWPGVSEVTLRRDMARLEGQGRLRRTHGGAVRIGWSSGSVPETRDGAPASDRADAVILPPIAGRWAHTLRAHALRRGIPIFAESSPQDGGTYLGPDNREAGRDLGRHAASLLASEARRTAEILLLSLDELPNTRDRARGFVEGFREACTGAVRTHVIDGKGAFVHAYRSALDALQAYPGIDVLFGVNDHSILAGIEACATIGREPGSYSAFSVGGEGSVLFETLLCGHPLRACAALFPEAVGRIAIDAIGHVLSGGRAPAAIETGYAILTPANLGDHYVAEGEHWRPRPEVLRRLTAGRDWRFSEEARGKRISFILHYPSHDWYRNLAAAMAGRAAELGLGFAARNAEDRYAQEIGELREALAATAAAYVRDGETLLLDGGETSRLLAAQLRGRATLTVVTNSLAVLDALKNDGPRVVLTGGEVAVDCGLMLGPPAAAVLETMRVDKAFLAVDGVAAGFGLSSADPRIAELSRRFVDAAREVVVLADHSLMGFEARAQICALDRVDTIITDAGTLPAHRMELSAAGLRVMLAGDEAQPGGGRAGPAA